MPPITEGQCDEIIEYKDTIGGTTYEVKRKGEDDFQLVCFRKYQYSPLDEAGDFKRCSRPAGWGTRHKGTGACKNCGGNIADVTVRKTITHGRTAHITRGELADQIDEYLDKDKEDLMDLSYEFAATRAIFVEFIKDFPPPTDDNFGRDLHRATTLVGTIGSLMDKISRTTTRKAVTVHQIMYVRAVVADILMKFIRDPDERKLAANELATRLGGTTEYAVVTQPANEDI